LLIWLTARTTHKWT